MATIQERTDKNGKPTYTVTIRAKGHKSQTATFRRVTDYKEWITRTEAAIKENRHFKTNQAKKHTLGEVIDRYFNDVAPIKFTANEQRIRAPILQWWKTEIGYLRLADLTAKEFADCRDKLIKYGGSAGRPLAAATIKRHFVAINHVLKICHTEWRILEQNPLKESALELPELPRGIVRFLDDEELPPVSNRTTHYSTPLLFCRYLPECDKAKP